MITHPVFGAVAGITIAAGLALAIAGARGTAIFQRQNLSSKPQLFANRRLQARIAAASAAALLVLLIIGWPVAALVTWVAAFWLPGMMSGRPAKERITRLQAVESWIRQLSDGLSGNSSLEEVLLFSAEHPPPALASEVTMLATRIRLGIPLPDALQSFADDVDDELGDMAVGALIFAADARGPGLRQVLSDLAGTVARRVETAQQIDAERASHRVTARGIIVALILFSAFAMFNKDYVAPFGSPFGQVVLGGVGVLWAVAIRWIHKLANPEPAYRFLQDSRRP